MDAIILSKSLATINFRGSGGTPVERPADYNDDYNNDYLIEEEEQNQED